MIHHQRSFLNRFLIWSSRMVGHPIIFVFALVLLIFWFIIGLISGFTVNWLLILNTLATVNASLMVFIIQNTQYRENKALHLKIDELLRVNKETERELIAIEEKEEEELEQIRRKIYKKEKS